MLTLLDNNSGFNEKQVSKINTIVMTMDRRFKQATVQKKNSMPVASQSVKSYDATIINIEKDKYYNGHIVLSLIIDTTHWANEKKYGLLIFKDNIKPLSVIGYGVDSLTTPSTQLSMFGSFYLDNNILAFDCIQKPSANKYYVTITATAYMD